MPLPHAFTVWAHAHFLLLAGALVLFGIVSVLWERRGGGVFQRRHDRADAAEAARVKTLGLDLTYRETALLATRRHIARRAARDLNRRAR